MTADTLTNQQIEAVMAVEENPEFDGKSVEEIGAALAAEGHEAWSGKKLPAAPNELPLYDDEQLPQRETYVPEGGEELGAGDFTVPYLAIRQPMSKADAPTGSWYLSVDHGRNVEKITFAVLAVRPFLKWQSPHEQASKNDVAAALEKAQYFGLTVDKDHKGAYCFSPDRLSPIMRDHGVVSVKCKGCPAKSAFVCRPGYELIVVDMTDYDGEGPAMEPAKLTVKGKSCKPWKTTQTLLHQFARRAEFGYRAFQITATTVKDTSSENYIAKFGKPTRINVETLEMLDGFYEAFAARGAE